MSTFENDAQSPKKGYLSKGKVCFLIQNSDWFQITQKFTYSEKFNDLCNKNNILKNEHSFENMSNPD